MFHIMRPISSHMLDYLQILMILDIGGIVIQLSVLVATLFITIYCHYLNFILQTMLELIHYL
jgi:hypothetical protein